MVKKIRPYLFLLLFTIVSPIITKYIIFSTSPFGNWFQSNYNTDAWIGFAGSIIGGCITMLGVIYTIEAQETQQFKDISIQYLPIFTIKDIHESFPYEEDRRYKSTFDFILTNVGRGEATIVSIETDDNSSMYRSQIRNQKEFKNSFVPLNSQLICSITFEMKEELSQLYKENFHTATPLSYEDCDRIIEEEKFKIYRQNFYERVFNLTIRFKNLNNIIEQQTICFYISANEINKCIEFVQFMGYK